MSLTNIPSTPLRPSNMHESRNFIAHKQFPSSSSLTRCDFEFEFRCVSRRNELRAESSPSREIMLREHDINNIISVANVSASESFAGGENLKKAH